MSWDPIKTEFEGKPMMRLIIFAFFLTTATASGAWALEQISGREDTARLTFRKNPVTTTKTYVVKKGDTLLKIMSRELGIKQNRYTLIRRYNPYIKDLDKIYPGQRITLPVMMMGDASTETGDTPPTAAREEGVLDRLSQTPPTVYTLNTIRSILGRMKASFISAGSFHIPLSASGEITIDCSSIPMAEFSDGTHVFIDFRNTLPEDVRLLLEKNWSSFKVLRVRKGETVWDILWRCINASRIFKMERHQGLYRIGENPSLTIPADWIITDHTGSDKKGYRQVICPLRSSADRVPEAVLTFAEQRGTVITEIYNDTVCEYPPASQKAASKPPLPRITGPSQKATIYNLLEMMGYRPDKDIEIRIFDLKMDGFNLSIKADLSVVKDTQRLIVVFRPLPSQFVAMLRAKRTDVAVLSEKEPSKKNIRILLENMGIPFSTVPYSLPVSLRPALDDVRLVFPTIRIAAEGKPPLYLIDFDLEGGLYDLLHNELGFSIVRY